MNPLSSLTERANNTSRRYEEAFKVLRENLKDEAIEVVLEGPNIVFKSNTFEFLLNAIKYKPQTNHEDFNNVLGQISVVFTGENIDKLEKAFQFVFQAAKSEIFLQQENDYTYLKII